jgi:DNA-binding transcriptional MerR regulator
LLARAARLNGDYWGVALVRLRHSNRDANQEVAMFGDMLVQAAALRSQDDRGWRGELHFVVILWAALVEAVDPVAGFLQFFERAGDVGDADHGQVGQGSGGRALHHLGQAGGAALGNDDGGGSGGVRGADNRTQIVRVLYAVQHDVQPAVCRGFVQAGVLGRGSQGDHSLVRNSTGRAVQRFAGLEAYRNFALAAQIDQFLNPRACGALGDEHALERAAPADCLPDGMDSCKRRHYDKGTLMSAHENIPMQPAYEIPDKLYFRIGEVARLAGIKPYVLRFWETEFPGLGPKKSGTGHRLYRRKDVELVLEIKRLLYEKRFTIEGARKFLDLRGKPEPVARAPKPVKSAKVQGDLFPDTSLNSSALEAVRKELAAIAEMLK